LPCEGGKAISGARMFRVRENHNSMKLLLISNSTMAGEAYLDWPRSHISEFLNRHQVKKVCFVPYAGISLSKESLISSYNIYTHRVAEVF